MELPLQSLCRLLIVESLCQEENVERVMWDKKTMKWKSTQSINQSIDPSRDAEIPEEKVLFVSRTVLFWKKRESSCPPWVNPGLSNWLHKKWSVPGVGAFPLRIPLNQALAQCWPVFNR